MNLKEFFQVINHRFRNAQLTENNLVKADLINWADEPIGGVLYEIGDSPMIKGVECYIGNKVYTWGDTVSELSGEVKTLSDILSILRGLLESKNQMEIIDDHAANVLIESVTVDNTNTVTIENYKNNNTKEYHVTINATFSCVVNSATMDHALTKFKDRLKFPDNIQCKINSESVEIKYT
jgi:urease gamma subunit